MNPVYALQKINTWWRTGEVDHKILHTRIRNEFGKIVKSLDDKRITSIIGPTGVGKTSLLFDVINNLLFQKIPPIRIVYFSGNDMTLFGEHRSVGSLLEIYATEILHENLFAFQSPVYIIIDDIQFIDDWQIYLVNYIKKAPNIKFLISHPYSQYDVLSAEDEIIIPIMPLTQPQFAELYSAYRLTDIDLIRFKSLLPGTSLFKDPSGYYEELSSNVYSLADYKPYKTKIMDEYLLCGGYPAYFNSQNVSDWQSKLLDSVDHSLYRDIGAQNGIKSPQKLKRLLYIIASTGSLEQSFVSIGHSLYVDTSTIIGYISSLSDGGYAGVTENYSLTSAQKGRVVRKNKRLFVFDTGVRNALLGISNISADYTAVVTNSCLYMAHEYAVLHDESVFFWKDGRRTVDIVIGNDKNILPVSVCCKREQLERAVKSLKAFMRMYDAEQALVITKDVLKQEGNTFFIPYWMI